MPPHMPCVNDSTQPDVDDNNVITFSVNRQIRRSRIPLACGFICLRVSQPLIWRPVVILLSGKREKLRCVECQHNAFILIPTER